MSITLYDYPLSGHAHRVRLFLSLLGIEHATKLVDMRQGEHLGVDYLALNPRGQVPTLVDGDSVITDSCAALVYLAKRQQAADWLPEDPAGAAAVQRWLSTASGELYRGPVLARAIKLFGRDFDHDAALSWSARLLGWMDGALSDADWLAAQQPTIADIAMYSYLSVADEGGVDVGSYRAVARWLGAVEKLDGFVPMARAGQ